MQANKLLMRLVAALLIIVISCKSTKKVVTDKNVITLDTVVATAKAGPEPERYNAAETRINDIIHTKLDVRFDWNKRHLLGKATIDIKPYFYPVSTLKLDARGFDIKEVALVKGGNRTKLNHTYDGKVISVPLDREYKKDETYTVYIEYVAKPDDLQAGGSEAINSDKGLYFINPDGKEEGKPRQIWTQGETQANSAWYPTIDRPNERMTQEIYITIDKNFTTLSNGILVTQYDNADGTRTDHWKMDLPHAPYLTMMAIGEFAVVKDSTWRGRTVDYYVEPEYSQHAKAIFGNTGEMLDFYSGKLGVEYPWSKYSQVVVRDYVSGAMENTTATIHGEFLQRTDRELLDNTNEDIIAHELFHQWFGDLVTCESWANLPLNESFATYGEYLWDEHKYGRDAADHRAQQDLSQYLQEAKNKQVDMIRFDYEDKEDMFDSHSYAKGGRILHMLRKYVGDEAFFAALKLYLEKHKFTAVEIHDLRLAFEQVTGEDLNWFFNQWFLNSGHPELSISTSYSDSAKKVKVTVEQNQDFSKTPLYKLPVDIDVYTSSGKKRERVTLTEENQDFYIESAKPMLVNVDAEKMLLAVKRETKTPEQWVYQYANAPLYLDRYEAIDNLAKEGSPAALETVFAALNDKYWNIRALAVKNIRDLATGPKKEEVKNKLKALAQKDEKSAVRATALSALAKYYTDQDLMAVYKEAVGDRSYSVVSQALTVISEKDKEQGLQIARTLDKEKNPTIINTVAAIYATSGTDAENQFFLDAFKRIKGFEKYNFVQLYAKYLMNRSDDVINKGLPVLEDVARNEKAWWVRLSGTQSISGILTKYTERETELLSKIEQGKKANQQTASLESELAQVRAQKEKITKLLNDIKKSETDKNLLRIYGNQQ